VADIKDHTTTPRKTRSEEGAQSGGAMASAFAAASSAPSSSVDAVSASQPRVGQGTAQTSEKKLPQKDSLGRSYATGRRKTSAARVWIKPGTGRIVVNGKSLTDYFVRPVLQMVINQPFQVANRASQFDVMCTVRGGGLSGQAGAVRHGISQALALFEPELRAPIKKRGFLTRDSREVERKKYGRAKARRSYQFSKR